MNTESPEPLHKLLQDWAASRDAGAAHHRRLADQILSAARNPERQVAGKLATDALPPDRSVPASRDVASRRFPSVERGRQVMIGGSALLLVLVLTGCWLYYNVITTPIAHRPSAPRIGNSAGSSPPARASDVGGGAPPEAILGAGALAAKRQLLSEANTLFDDRVAWIADGEREVSLNVLQENTSLAGEFLLIRVVVAKRSTPGARWSTVWQADVISRSEALVEITPKQLNGSSLTLKARDEWRSYLRTLTRSERDVVKLYGYWGLLTDAWSPGSSSSSQGGIGSVSPLIEQVERYVAAARQLDPDDQQALTLLETNLGMMKNRFGLANSPASVPRPPASVSAAEQSGPRESFGRMQFNPISLVVEGEQDSASPPTIQGMLQCGETCDAYWTKDRFFVMHQRGILRELPLTDSTADHALYWSVTWDGECIWLYAHGQGIIAVRPDGTRLATFNQTKHLPGYWQGFTLLGLSPRRALMVASFGKTNRAWCGILEVDDNGKQSVNIFFEAKYVAEGRQPEAAAAEPKTAFQPSWIHRLQSHNRKDLVLVGRRDLPGALQIDLDTLDVSVSPYGTGSVGRHAFFSHDGHLLASLGGNQLIHYSPPGQDGTVRTRVLANISPYVDQLLLHDGWLYVPGRVWLRLDPDQRYPERLQPWPSRLPVGYWGLKGGVSAHFGLIAYDLYNTSPSLFQITILDASAEEQAKGRQP